MKQPPSARIKAPMSAPIRKKAAPAEEPGPNAPRLGAAERHSTVSKVSHTLTVALAERLEEFAFFQRISESAVIEHSLNAFFAKSTDDTELGDLLRNGGAGRRRKG